MKYFNNNENKPMKVNRPTYNWLNKLVETQLWEDCFYYISRQGLGYGFSFEHNDKIYTLDYKTLGYILPNYRTYNEFLLKALINGYTLAEPLYKVVDKNDFPLLTLHNNVVIKSFELTPYEQLQDDTKMFYTLTEEQIKDYDERYWAFAVNIED